MQAKRSDPPSTNFLADFGGKEKSWCSLGIWGTSHWTLVSLLVKMAISQTLFSRVPNTAKESSLTSSIPTKTTTTLFCEHSTPKREAHRNNCRSRWRVCLGNRVALDLLSGVRRGCSCFSWSLVSNSGLTDPWATKNPNYSFIQQLLLLDYWDLEDPRDSFTSHILLESVGLGTELVSQ